MKDDLRYADRSERAKFRVSGPQDAWFLDQILTQSFEDMAVGEARDAALITVHGRMTGYMEALRTPDGFFLHLEPELREPVGVTLQRYILATDVTVTDVTGELGLVLVVGEGWRDLAPGAKTVAVQATSSLGVDAGYLWVDRAGLPGLIETLQSAGGSPVEESELEAIRIANGIARWGREMDEKTFPQEAGVDERAVHYEKGCYLGQEAMAKIHFRGKVNRRLARIRAAGSLVPGSEISLDGSAVGKVTSASDGTALALVRYSVAPGTAVVVRDTPAEVVG